MSNVETILGPPSNAFKWMRRYVRFNNGRCSRGVTKIIRRIFASNYRFKQLNRTTFGSMSRRVSKRFGTRVDTAIDHWVRGLRVKEQHVRSMVKQLEQWSWRPVTSQLVVARPLWRLATRIDLIVLDTLHDVLLLIEVKTGCPYRHESNGKMMRFIRPQIYNSMLHQHQLQAVLSAALFSYTYPNCTYAVEPALLYMNHDGSLDLFRESQFQVHFNESIEQVLIGTSS